MRWGFNASILLEEALDRLKLFIESQAVNEFVFFDEEQSTRKLALRGINIPGKGVQMSLIGKVTASEQDKAERDGKNYARELFSIFPHDFILKPAETHLEYNLAAGTGLFSKNIQVAAIHRGRVLIPSLRPYQQLQGLWQASTRSTEQIWRALSNMPQAAILNILIQPSILLGNERKRLLGIKAAFLDSNEKPAESLPYHPWVDGYIKRRLAPWKKYFQVQVHVLVDGLVDENILRSIGCAMARDTTELALPGFEVIRPLSKDEEDLWREDIQALNLIPIKGMDDLADLEETFAIFRFPLRHEFGLPGAKFIEQSNPG